MGPMLGGLAVCLVDLSTTRGSLPFGTSLFLPKKMSKKRTKEGISLRPANPSTEIPCTSTAASAVGLSPRPRQPSRRRIPPLLLPV